ncbi:MAG: hypothetical protein V4787_22800 [Pseudomonadota bacterium]
MTTLLRRSACWAALPLALGASLVHAADEAPAFKFTTSVYQLSGGGMPSGTALDLNLRQTSDFGTLWIGWFRFPAQDTAQTRAGWDRNFEAGPVRIQPSVQAASGGFWGGSIALETGERWYAGVGLGRTNLRPYVNLNFDPNDAWTVSGGYRWEDGRAAGLLLVGDNRQNPDERHLHLTWREPLEGGQRLTLDLLAKRGLVNGELIHRFGVTAGYDWPRVFVRVAWDPKVNFTPQDMWRLQGGVRF